VVEKNTTTSCSDEHHVTVESALPRRSIPEIRYFVHLFFPPKF
jgi:hypothetical protein